MTPFMGCAYAIIAAAVAAFFYGVCAGAVPAGHWSRRVVVAAMAGAFWLPFALCMVVLFVFAGGAAVGRAREKDENETRATAPKIRVGKATP